ncbi:hypothetical protein Avbf_08159 [Armadillidium vulgare]|nr:hypothetical protein Avbf_08159 [Armadillidium vulgare]
MSEEFSLPPLIKDDVQGRLNMIILRPTLTPSLHPEQVLEFRYCWWGSENTHKIRLHPGCDDIRTVYDIRCDIKGLQRYFIDAEYLTVELSIVSDKESDLQNSSHEHQIRKKKEWKVGDFIGKFSLLDLKLNARGEYIQECSIYNNYGDHLGSVMIFILYTSGEQLVSVAKTKESRKENQTAKNLPKIKENVIHPQSGQITPKKKKVLSKENHSPRFVSFGKNNPVQHVIQKNNSEEENSNILSAISLSKKKHILKRLFSFVDSGALQLSDLPTLIQICQGRSPSLDLDSCDQIDDQIENISDYREKTKQKVIFSEEFLNSFSSNTDVDPGKLSSDNSSECELKDLKNKVKDKSVNSHPSEEESSLLVLLFHSVQLTDQLQKTDVNQQKKKLVVRQRSKICYFVEVVLEFEDVEHLQSTLLVSRQITETQEILFNSRKIFQLENGKDNGCLKFKVSSRQMGNQKPDNVGIGIISLNQIRSGNGNEKYVAVPLWVSNESSNGIKLNNPSVEKPVGYLIFSVAFSFSGVSSHCDIEENRLQTDKCSSNSNNSNSDVQIDNNFCTLQSQSGYKILEKGISPLQKKPLQPFENVTSQESLIIETSANFKYIPMKNMNTDSLKEVHLEILEGNGLPLLRSKRTRASFQPNSYVLTTIPPNFTFKTKIIRSSSSPVWNGRTNFSFHREDLEHTNYKLILKLFHSLDGESAQSDDPLLGFAPIEYKLLME